MGRTSSDKDADSSKRSREDRDRDYKHRSSRDDKHRDSSDSHRHSHRHRSDRKSHRDKSSSSRREDRESSRDRERDRERSREREVKRERSVEDRESSRDLERDRERSRERDVKRERSFEERESFRDHERHRERSRERELKRERSPEDDSEYERERERKKRKERRVFEDKEVEKEDDGVANDAIDRSHADEVVKRAGLSELVKEDESVRNGGVSVENGAGLKSLTKTSSDLPDSAPVHPFPTKVSSISNTNENKGVSITRSHEVPGKSSTDGTSSAAGKTGSLSLDALAKAKQALQRHKELTEMKKALLSKSNRSSTDAGDGSKGTSSGPGMVQGLVSSNTVSSSVPTGAGSASSTLSSGVTASAKPSPAGGASIPGLASMPDYEAVKRAHEVAAKLGFRQDPLFPTPLNLFPGQMPTEIAAPQKPTKAPVLRVDALGREIDEHGNVVNVTKPNNLSTLKVNINKQKKDAFQILKPELDVDPESNPHFDARMGIDKNKLLRPKRSTFQFVEEGRWSKEAESMKLRSQFGEERARDMKARQALHAKAKAAPDINPNLIEVTERVITKEKIKDPIPDIEWWDVPLLPGGNYGDADDGSLKDLKLKMEKITIYVEHPRPIEPPAEPAPPPPQPLKLTKKEQKKLRTQRRLAREKDRQEMIRQGLIEPPKPKVKMSNLMKVLGSEATQDPTRLEKEIRTAAAEREQAHIDRNIARKLTPAERREKKERKLFDDPNTLETIVSVYKINDLSHKKTRFKVDVNAHENRLTGCVVISEGITVVVVEGGIKSIKRYGKLMLKRINWAEAVNEDEDGDEDIEKPVNKCVLVWQGSVAKPNFNRFSVNERVTEAAARKFFADAGVAHYWDLAVNFSDDQI